MKKESTILNLTQKAVADVVVLTCEQFTKRANSVAGQWFDGVAHIRVGGQSIREPYIVKSALGSDTVHLLSMLRREHPDGLLVVAPHVNERIGNAIRSAKVHFMDTEGEACHSGVAGAPDAG